MNTKDYVWYLGFAVFQEMVHSLSWPLRIFKRASSAFVGSREKKSPASYAVPKKIWTFWAQGWENASPLVRLCRDSWKYQNPDWEVIELTEKDIAKYVTLDYSLEGKTITYTNYSNILRVAVMSKYGGVWADTTTLCTAPLDSWLPMMMQSGFFAFHKPKTTIADWFMAVTPMHALMEKWRRYVNTYWKFAKSEGRYFWPHYLFEYLIFLDSVARSVWRYTPKIDAETPYAARHYYFKSETFSPDVFIEFLFDRRIPVHKLDWRMNLSEDLLSQMRARLNMPRELT